MLTEFASSEATVRRFLADTAPGLAQSWGVGWIRQSCLNSISPWCRWQQVFY